MSAYDAIRTKLMNSDTVVLDGAMGTELERLGAPMHQEVWCGQALDTHPDLVREVHRSYIAAGADVITTNTYATARHSLESAGLEDKTVEWNALATSFALDAVQQHAGGRSVCVAGSVSTFGNFGRYTAEALRPNFAEQARILVDNGVDLVLLETLASPPDIVCALVEETAGLGVPVWVAVSCMEDRESGEIQHGVEESQAHGDVQRSYAPLAEVAGEIMSRGGDALLMMHSDLAVTEAAVRILASQFDGPVGAYPNAGYWLRPKWAFVDQISPADFAKQANGWVAAGASIVGGCCGIGPHHIAAFVDTQD